MRSASALRPTSTRPSLPTSTRLRAAVTAFFALDGFLFAGRVVRIPAVKERVGASATGLGLANAFPAAIARAGTAAGPTGVAAASTLGYGGMLIGPVCIGFLADAFGLPLALTTVAALAALAAGIALAAGRAAAARERKEGSTA